MKYSVSTFVLALGLLALAPVVALANDAVGPTSSVPELDPNAANVVLALIAGGAAVLNGRRRNRS